MREGPRWLSHFPIIFLVRKNYLQYQRQLIILLYMETTKLNPMAALQYGTRCSIELRLHSLLHFQTYTHPRDLYHLLYPLFTSLTLLYHDHENHIINYTATGTNYLPSGISSEANICVPRILASSSSNSWRKPRNFWGIEKRMANGEDRAVRKQLPNVTCKIHQ